MTLPTDYQNLIHVTRYSRWSDEAMRRETWDETTKRYVNFWLARGLINNTIYNELYDSIYGLQVMPSMRCMMTAGEALSRDNVAGYNCAFLSISDVASFAEMMYILMCGTGVGFSVERQYTNKLPELPSELHNSRTTIVVGDDRIAWARGFQMLLNCLYLGEIPKWDLSELRPAGARLKTFGGRSSGPGPLEDLFKFTTSVFRRAVDDDRRRLTSVECHDICCKIGEVVVSGGVRRSALISLSNLSDDRMRMAKSGNWYDATPWRALANNSATYTERPDSSIFIDEWRSLIQSKSGERGIYNVRAAQRQAARSGRRRADFHFGTNPCSEIILRDMQFCNLSEIVARPADSLDNLLDKARLATIIGTLQSTLTDFRFLRTDWKRNCEEERLLGVSLTGITDHPVLNGGNGTAVLADWLEEIKDVCIATNREWADSLGINRSTAITCVKPSGTVSQLVNSASGIHTRYARYYIRRVTLDTKDPVCQMLKDSGFPGKPASSQHDRSWLFDFPMKSPDTCLTRHDLSALEQLELWLAYQEHWCEHKPSCTIYVKDSEWMDVGAWVYRNFDKISGLSFLPSIDGETIYAGITPYEEIDEQTYDQLRAALPKIDWSLLLKYETTDETTSSRELACTAQSCEI